MKFLYAAYLATWAIHIVYILTINARVRQLRRDWDELRKR